MAIHTCYFHMLNTWPPLVPVCILVFSTWSLKLCSLMALLQLIFALAIWLSRQTDTWLALWLADVPVLVFCCGIIYIYIYIYIFCKMHFRQSTGCGTISRSFFFPSVHGGKYKEWLLCLFYRMSCNLLHSCWQELKELHAWFHW